MGTSIGGVGPSIFLMETGRSWLRSWGFGSGKKSFDSIPNLLRLTLGLRRSTRERLTLDREHRSIDTAYGNVRVKVAKRVTESLICGQNTKISKLYPWKRKYH